MTARPRLTPRKIPRQARSSATLDAVIEAAVQLLELNGPGSLTTTRVALRAGVSVGTLYQYFPHKQALLYAITERYLRTVADEVERGCQAQHGAPIARMAGALVDAYWDAKTVRCKLTRALYLVAAEEVDASPLVEAFSKQLELMVASMFASAPDAHFDDLELVSLTLMTSLSGTVRTLFDRGLPKPWACGVKEQLVVMCTAYLNAANTPSISPVLAQ